MLQAGDTALSKQKRVRIVYEGDNKPFSTKITDAETGEEMPGIFKAVVLFDVSAVPQAILSMYAPVVDVVVDASVIHHCPYCRRPLDESAEQSREDNAQAN